MNKVTRWNRHPAGRAIVHAISLSTRSGLSRSCRGGRRARGLRKFSPATACVMALPCRGSQNRAVGIDRERIE
jgi:hypothetical protein